MFIEEVILDGFKSYAQRTKIGPFDEKFNAITGLNGSGKSNILDAICFVLGITNLRQVRVTDMAGLVYKKGHGGIKKATVTLVFNNEDKSSSPIGYEQHDRIHVTRQVMVEGRSKYLVNGHNAQQNRVQALFHSVGLNVNNPHFLIMQGHILKVVKMKAMELKGLLEEAAGTKMFENNRAKAVDVIAKKEKKVEEIVSVVENDINPTLGKLQEELKNFKAWSENNTLIQQLERFCLASKYHQCTSNIEESDQQHEKNQELVKSYHMQMDDIISSFDDIDENTEKFSVERQKLLEEGKEKEKSVTRIDKQLAMASTNYENATASYNEEKKRQQELEEGLRTAEQLLLRREQDLIAAKTALEEKGAVQERAGEHVEELKHAALAGVSTKDNEGTKSLADQVMDCKSKASNAQSQQAQLSAQISHMMEEIKGLKRSAKNAGTEETKLQQRHDACKRDIAKIERELETISFDPKKEEELFVKRRALQNEINALQEKIDKVTVADYQLHYTNPGKGFKPENVKGRLGTLVTVKDAKRHATAVEVAAGAKLKHVVVTDEKTGSDLVTKGNMARVTVIPLNKISSNPINDKTKANAQQLVGKENVSTALDLVEYDPKIQPAVQFAFGSTLVCRDSEHAKKLAFDKSVRKRTVTESGDVFDPKGTISGGARIQSSNLSRQTEVNKLMVRLRQLECEVQETEKLLSALQCTKAKYEELSSDLEVKQHEFEGLEQRLSNSPHHALMQKVAHLEEGVSQRTNELKNFEMVEKEALKQAKVIEKDMKNAEKSQKSLESKMEKEVAQAKKKWLQAKEDLKKTKQNVQSTSLEITELEKEIKSFSQQLTEVEKSIQDAEKEMSAAKLALEDHQRVFDDERVEFDQWRAGLDKIDEQLKRLQSSRQSKQKEVDSLSLLLQKANIELERSEKQRNEALQYIGQLESSHSWLVAEKESFGVKGGEFDFSSRDPKKERARLKGLQAKQDKLGQSINRKVMNMYDKSSQQYEALLRKKNTIIKDREEIEKFIEKLDAEKKRALQTAFKKVNEDFSNIFSTLLPGWDCKLVPCEGKTIDDGLEIKFARDGIWKDSLSELSGGQRSLLALSLILSFLLFKPAPVYILDEVDSALDLSNTQNIGKMLKKSQFVIVSLKEGMWNNANVLFKTKFVDGVSTVSRVIPGAK